MKGQLLGCEAGGGLAEKSGWKQEPWHSYQLLLCLQETSVFQESHQELHLQ